MQIRPVLSLMLFLAPLSAAAQQNCAALSMRELRLYAIGNSIDKPIFNKAIQVDIPHSAPEIQAPHSAIFLPQWAPTDLPVFCRIEHEIGKKIPVMVKFRLGSVDYVDRLEGKALIDY